MREGVQSATRAGADAGRAPTIKQIYELKKGGSVSFFHHLRRLGAMGIAGVFVLLGGLGGAYAAPPGADVCKNCHEQAVASYAKSVHGLKNMPGSPASSGECSSCHGDGTEHVNKGGGKGVGGMISLNSKNLSAQEKTAKCLSCHTTTKNLLYWDMGVHKKNDVACADCHSVHSGGPKLLASKVTIQPFATSPQQKQYETCFACHKDIRSAVNRMSHHPILEGKVKCSDCHNPHGTLAPKMIKADSNNQLCYTCHADKRGPFVWEHAPVEENCMACHNPHGSKSYALLNEKPPLLCQDCHDWGRHPGTQYDARAGFPGTNSRQTVTSPSNRFYARSCTNCHTQIHGSNAPFNSDNGYNSGKAFVR